jgi:uncharacterized protein (DUF1778 family)
MPSHKTETLTVRLAPDIKAALREAAAHEHRSLANMLEVMIRDWWDAREDVPLRGQPVKSQREDRPVPRG